MNGVSSSASYLGRTATLLLFCAVAATVFWGMRAVKAGPEDRAMAAAERMTRAGLLLGFSGNAESRDTALRGALRVAPDYALARWHMGQIRTGQRWLTTEQFESRMATDSQLREYGQLRDAASGNPRRQLALARWCRDRQLHDARRLHLRQVLASDSASSADRERALDRLELRPYGGTFVPQAEIEQLEARLAKQRQERAKWTPIVERWRKAIEGGPGRKQRFALEQLRDVKDPAAISTLESVMSPGREDLALEVVALLGTMPEYESTQSLVSHALGAPWSSVRDAAVQQLQRRPLHDYAPLVLCQLEAPVLSKFYVGVGPDGLVRHQHHLLREGPQENHLMTNSYIGGPRLVNTKNKVIQGARDLGPKGERARKELTKTRLEQAEQLRHAEAVRRMVLFEESVRAIRMQRDVASVNAALARNNDRAFDVLEHTAGEKLPRSPAAWWEWWQDYNEVYRDEKPTYTYQFGRVDPYYVPWTSVTLMSCFPAGTQVHGETGLVNIEHIRPGDRVLSQNIETGELAYQLVQQTTVRPPSELLRITLGSVTITTTKGHPFWVNDVGWRMAKRLEGGQPLHAIRGVLTIDSIEPAASAKAYNLVVADFGTYFVGQPGVLVHDNTYRKPTTVLTPGLAPG